MVYTTGLFLVTIALKIVYISLTSSFFLVLSRLKLVSHSTNVCWTSAFNEVKLSAISVCLSHGINEKKHGFGCHGKEKKI